MYLFENTYCLYALLLIPIIVLVYWFYKTQYRKNLALFVNSHLLKSIMPEVSIHKKTLKFILFTTALLFLILGLANLQTGSKLKKAERDGADLILCLDVSNSMLARDLSPNRLERAKLAIETMVNKLKGDRIGIVVFAGEAYVQLPITVDYGAAKLFLNSIDPRMMPIQGTNIADAINKASECFSDKDNTKSKAIIIITDGENNEEAEESAISAAKESVNKNIIIHTIGMGSEEGVPIPNYVNGSMNGFKKDRSGNTVVTKLDSKILKEIAFIGKGTYVKATNRDLGLESILKSLNQLEKKLIETKTFSEYENQYQWFLAVALLLLLIESLLTERYNKIIRKLNVFGNAKK